MSATQLAASWKGDIAACAQEGQPVLSIIVPTFNERENVAFLLALLHRHLGTVDVPAQARSAQQPERSCWWWEAVVVDDASPDGTASLIRQLQSDPQLGANLRLVERPGKLGLGTAYSAGLAQARGRWAALMDADLSHHPSHLPHMLAMQDMSGCDIVAGTRYRPGGGVSGWDWRRKLTSRGANLLAATLLGVPQSDLTGAYRLYRRACLEQLLGAAVCRGYAFQMEVAVRAHYLGFRVQEVPIVFVDRLFGKSKLGAHEFAGFIAGLLHLFTHL